MSVHNHPSIVIAALEDCKGDDTIRARMTFRNHTPEQMQEQYGQSGRTCAEILESYEASDHAINETIAWFKELMKNIDTA